MSIEEMPIAAIRASHRTTGDGVHLVARRYRKGVRLHTHMHREAQLVFAAKGTMQVTTPKGRWLVPPDRAVWVPPRLEHSIDVLADIEMRTLYFDSAWLAREQRSDSLEVEFVVRVSRLLHETILALFDGGTDPDRTGLLTRLAVLELHHAEDSTTFIPLPHEPRCRRAADIVLADPTASHEIEAVARAVGTSARTLVPARAHRGRDRKTVDGSQCLDQATGRRSRLCQRACFFARVPAGHRQDADAVFGREIGPIRLRRILTVTPGARAGGPSIFTKKCIFRSGWMAGQARP